MRKIAERGVQARRVEPGDDSAIASLGMVNPWGFRVIAVDEKTSIPLVDTQAETYEIAISRIESDLRDLDIID